MEKIIEHRDCRLAYRVQGQGTPVVWIQGVGVQGHAWRPQVEGLEDVCQSLTFDNRGMGASQPTKATAATFGAAITVEQMAEDTVAIMDAAGFAEAHIVGHSLGGLVALELALRARTRVKSLVLMCTFADGRVAMRLTARMLWLGTRSRVGPRGWRRRAFMQIVMSREGLAHADRNKLSGDLAGLFGHDLADSPPVVSHQLSALKKYDATPRLSQIAGIPTLVMSAAQDPIARPAEGGRPLAKGILGADYLEYADAAHGLPIEHAQRVNAVLRRHFAQLR